MIAAVDLSRAAHPKNARPHKSMGRMSDDPTKPPRFPFVAALLCTACVGAGAWTWMRYSYCWTYELDELPGALRRHGAGELYGRYVRIPAPVGPLGMSVLVGVSHDLFFFNDGTTPVVLRIPRGTDEEAWLTHGSRARIRVGPHIGPAMEGRTGKR